MFDAHKNLAVASVVTPPAPASSGTTLVVGAGQGARFGAVPFNATVWPIDMAPDPTTAEVVRVTARTTDTLTITRAQEGTTARTILAGDLIAATITAKSLTDIESGTNFPLITTPGTVTSGADLVFTNTGTIRTATVDGADDKYVLVTAAGGIGSDRGAYFAIYGNELSGGSMTFVAGNTSTGVISFHTGTGGERGRIHPSGGLSWGSTTDPMTFSASCSMTSASAAPALALINPGTGDNYPLSFRNGNGQVGFVNTNGTTTTYSTTSDARLKTPLSRHTDTEVLRNTVIHNFVWKSDGTVGRGVFAQEAHVVAPFAVSVGTDDVDAEGRLTKPWGVDYSKYVPDLITGWQAHEAEMVDLRSEVFALKCRLAEPATPAPEPRMTLWQRVREAIAVLFPAWITP